MKRIILWPYKIGSTGAKELQAKINELCPEARCLRVRSDGRYRPHPNHLIVNWGNSSPNGRVMCQIAVAHVEPMLLNYPEAVATAANKLESFLRLSDADVSVPDWTGAGTRGEYGRPRFEEYLQEGKRVYCRTKLTGHSGDGIVVARTIEELVDAPLYTVGIDARAEYRIHVFNGEILDVQKKRRSNDALAEERLNLDVRNLAGGWVYARNNVDPPVVALDHAKRAVEALGLDFGAVDIIEEKRTGNCYVLEVNSAPGITGITATKYAEALINLANSV